MYILKNSDIITTLGKRQEDALDKLGIKSYIRVPNAVDIPDWNADDILYDKSAQQINILHLSTLIETKGFSNYVEALKLLPKNNNWNAILCGPVLFTKYCKTFSTIKQKEEYVLQNIEYLSPYSTWIRGAYGIEKFELFKNADIFIFPSTFNAESLPLVVLEAAASGCAIICTKVGEIPNYFSNDEILFLDSPDAKEISDKVQQLLLNKNTIQKYKYNAYQKYLRFFSKEAYKLNWISLFNQ
ncbi:hypothetical protein FACS189438_2020 [Bacteroidia bacterium]|nr:hypothetical protein FACS189438_2020 [Bacteroidia bacterium]